MEILIDCIIRKLHLQMSFWPRNEMETNLLVLG